MIESFIERKTILEKVLDVRLEMICSLLCSIPRKLYTQIGYHTVNVSFTSYVVFRITNTTPHIPYVYKRWEEVIELSILMQSEDFESYE